ncbi:MAG TPA: hypothetical protein VET23_07610, partial [Chitinophagaceae bacterium]|nr:hypothetical protein [Chitinophagaceae bacterium]
KCGTFFIIIFVLDFAAGSILKYLYFKQSSGILYRTTYTIDSTKADILIFGASTANHHYDAIEFEKRLDMSCYNTGRDGNYIFYHYAILKAILKRYTPKIAILDFNDKDFIKDQESYDRISSLLPYYNKHPEMRSIIQLKSPFEKYKLISKIYPYNSLLFTIGVGNTGFNKNRENINDMKGYIPLKEVWKEQLTTNSSPEKYKLDSVKINILESFISDCLKSNIKLYIFVSPRFIKYTYTDQSIEIAQKMAQKFNIPFYDFMNDPFFLNNRDLFFNPGHLNDNGAKIYSEMVIDKIIQSQQEDSLSKDPNIPK